MTTTTTAAKEWWVIGHKIERIDTSGEYDALVGETPAGVPGPPPHYHATFSELFMVLKGQMEFLVDGRKVLLNEGESIDLPPGTVHTFSNPTNSAIRWLNVHSPKGFQAFFHRFGIPATEEGAFQSSVAQTVIEQVIREAKSYDMIIV